MPKLTPAQMTVLQKVCEQLHVTPYYDNKIDGIEDGIHFKDKISKEDEPIKLLALQLRIELAQKLAKSKPMKELLGELGSLIEAGNKSVYELLPPYAVISNKYIEAALPLAIAEYVEAEEKTKKASKSTDKKVAVDKKAAVETAVAELRRSLNQSDDDAPSTDAQQSPKQKGLGEIAARASQKGWTRS